MGIVIVALLCLLGKLQCEQACHHKCFATVLCETQAVSLRLYLCFGVLTSFIGCRHCICGFATSVFSTTSFPIDPCVSSSKYHRHFYSDPWPGFLFEYPWIHHFFLDIVPEHCSLQCHHYWVFRCYVPGGLCKCF
jgi:hypothetical protein